jgi:hypothetical protein
MATKQLNTNRKVGGIVWTLVGLSFAIVLLNGGCGLSVESQLENMAKKVNAGLPKQNDAVTRWDRVEAGPGKTCTYIYTLSINLDDSQKEEVKRTVTAKIKAIPEMKTFLDAGITVWFKYRDASGKSILEFSVKN